MNKSLGERFNVIEKEIIDGLKKLDIVQDNFRKLKEDVIKNHVVIVEKSNEKLVFELIRADFQMCYPKYKIEYQDFKNSIVCEINEMNKIQLFTIIMKGVQELLEGDNEFKSQKQNCYINYSTENEKYFIDYDFNHKRYPNLFYFSSTENTKKAINILSNFFEENLLNWWYKQ